MEKLLTVANVAELLSIPPQRVYALCEKGIIPYIRVGRSLRFSPEQLERFIADGGKGFECGWRKDVT
ncbi:MAG: helix-turn-helix domain-containing protein [bacterium]|nr:helix-turn-helix domain-containing protein [bacterium]